MSVLNCAYAGVISHLNDLASRVVAQSGIPTDRYHVGKILLQSLRDAPPDFILQIDDATGETETAESVLRRSVQCANAFKKMGLKTHDTIVVMAPNHIHLSIPMYASYYIGVAAAGMDITLKVAELEKSFNVVLPKIVFCQDQKATEVHQALRNINHDAQIVTFDDSERWLTLSKLLEMGDYSPVDDFKASDFDTETTAVLMCPTSGTTGMPKFVVASHKSWMISPQYLLLPPTNFPTPDKLVTLVSPIQWLTAVVLISLSAVVRFTRLQSSLPVTPEYFQDLVNKYKPAVVLSNPNLFLQFMDKPKCDLTCFERIVLGGSAVPTSLVKDIKEATPNTVVYVGYGMSEALGAVFDNCNTKHGSLGVRMSYLQYRLVNSETQEDITEPNVPGELWLKGPGIFTCYYNNPEMTAEAKTEEGWFKTGDSVYEDDNGHFFYGGRLKMTLKYMNHQIAPVEIEEVIMKHPGVLTVAVTKIPDTTRGDLPVACVVRREGYQVTAQEIKDLVKDSLTDTKQLRGGVIFMKELPMTPSMKVNRQMLESMVRDLETE